MKLPKFLFFMTFLIAVVAWVIAIVKGDDLWLPLAFVFIGIIGMRTFE